MVLWPVGKTVSESVHACNNAAQSSARRLQCEQVVVWVAGVFYDLRHCVE